MSKLRALPWWLLVLLFAVLLVGMITVLRIWIHDTSSFVNNVILLVTGLVVLWYTIETYLLRSESQRANVTATRPVLTISAFKRIDPEHILDDRLIIKNSGMGPALNVE